MGGGTGGENPGVKRWESREAGEERPGSVFNQIRNHFM